MSSRRLRGKNDDLNRFAMSVQFCQKDSVSRPEHPQVIVDIHHPGGGWNGWTLVVSIALFDVGDQINYHYAPTQNGSDAQFDVRMRVSLARPVDLFNIGVAWDEPMELLGE